MPIPNNLPDPSEIYGTGGDGPIPHYPDWMYHCPACNRPWECDVRFSEKFVTRCFDCSRKAIAEGRK